MKAVIDQYSQEATALKGELQTYQVIMGAVVSAYGKTDAKGNLVLSIPAKSRPVANSLQGIEFRFSNKIKPITHGSITVKGIKGVNEDE